MSIDALREALPLYAKDLGQNFATLADETHLTDQQKWGCFLAVACADPQAQAVKTIEDAARQAGLSDAAVTAAKASAAIMAMNNVYYRAMHLMKNAEYRTMPIRLRMNVIANPGVDKTDFELWAFAVSAMNGCGLCLDAHEGELKKRGFSNLAIQAALRIAAVVFAISRVLAAEAAAAS
jgi:alkyl hydroperoxide reductase subunit D